mgnify:CR=1 FL=1
MEYFTGWEYLLIDVANQYGLDKKLFHKRIEWAEAYLDTLENYISEADDPEMYQKAVMAVRQVQQGKPTGHLVGFDAVCSGMQVMSAVMACENGCESTGLINPNERADAYTKTTDAMSNILGSQITVDRASVKDATMTL